MAPGTYDFKVAIGDAGYPMLTVRNRASARQAVMIPLPGRDAPKAWRDEGTPKITFACVDGNCTLRSVWNGRDGYEYEVPAHKLRPAEKERLAVVTIGLTRTE